MADFHDVSDPELAAACNRLAPWVEPLPEGVVIDTGSQLTERDLALILRRLYRTRHIDAAEPELINDPPHRASRASVPITAKS